MFLLGLLTGQMTLFTRDRISESFKRGKRRPFSDRRGQNPTNGPLS